MTAAVITATAVQKYEVASSIISGSTEKRLVQVFLEGPKAAQNDWFLLSTYLSTADCSNVAQVYATVDGEGSSYNVPVLDTWSYTSADAKIVLSGATTGVSRVIVTYWTE